LGKYEKQNRSTASRKTKGAARRKYILQRNALAALCIILALVLIVMIFATAYIHQLLGSLNYVDPEKESTVSSSHAESIWYDDPDLETIDPDSTEEHVDISDITPPTTPPETGPTVPLEYPDDVVNILLIGEDRRDYETSRQRADVMMLLTFNKTRNTVTMTSFMRDQYVQIPGYKPNKLNASYAFGGMSLLNETLRKNYGVIVDGDVKVDFAGFEDVIDMIGGVEITLTDAEAEYMNRYHGYSFTGGLQRLSGPQALNYVRIRKLDSDYRRAERQRNVINSLIKEFKNQSVTDMLDLMEELLPLVSTNMSSNKLISYAKTLFPMLSTAQINTMRIPVDGTFDSGNVQIREGFTNWFQYNIDFQTNRQILGLMFGLR